MGKFISAGLLMTALATPFLFNVISVASEAASPTREEIVTTLDRFLIVYGARDATAVTMFYAADATATIEGDGSVSGRGAIGAAYAGVFDGSAPVRAGWERLTVDLTPDGALARALVAERGIDGVDAVARSELVFTLKNFDGQWRIVSSSRRPVSL